MPRLSVREKLTAGMDLTEYGYWLIFPESMEASPPLLEAVEGIYKDVVNYALLLKGFITWGKGGRIHKINITKLDEELIEKRKKLLDEQKQLQERLRQINEELKFN